MAYSAKSQKTYNVKNYEIITIKLHKEKEAEIISLIEQTMKENNISKQAAVKKLLVDRK